MTLAEPHFGRVRFRGGYVMAEVDAFIERLQATVDGRPIGSPVTADDVRAVRFNTVQLAVGYDIEQVDLFLDQVAALLDRTG